MKRFVPLLLGALLLGACSQSPGGTGSGRPELSSGIEVRFPAAPSSAYLSLLTGSGESVYQVAVPAGATSVAVDGSKWGAQAANAESILEFLPAEALNVSVNAAGIKANFLHWVMWQDKNSDGKLTAGEALDLMTHDRVAYVSQDAEVKFSTPSMNQVWKLKQGWSRAEHYVYLPTGSATYQRRLESSGVQRYELHLPTPVTSQ
ncbi:hypothetical protein D3875_14395 [Deinococcus cavernae]|uniref:EF-hand domain-containing protein n=1 Tax=Deinococcus cavernae TaxID=2320857 RepID=A0A418V8W5_9DEIO|nr:hypothetical protein [Deinococcus cavernae]RJF72555.1 hypothetical protein D3875_14395 [Deinococcus cavernae]